ncbi:leucine--tRNA ligase [Ureaplasma canigenitalium]|uniref:leucine--tRNA ligase n=1 Tax=Ureaplasma canigenitalium TaxID=42092 RepID=UPI0004E21B44|nr:leucine--tRNA ligase [Ureaplasma canigenitalium]
MYNHNKIEQYWKDYFEQNKVFKFKDRGENYKKFYVLDMFPYPSGYGMHVGHIKGYTATDIISRYKRLKGYDVLHPIGWDAFGLPAEQFAIKNNVHPGKFTEENINNFRRQLKSIGFDYDYDKEVNTTDPNFYRTTQYIFSLLYKHNLACILDVDVNWCEELGTVLSNEEVVQDKDGNPVSERGGFPVVQRPMKQWVLKITEFADSLLDGLKEVDWPQSLKSLQSNWIGKSNGVIVDFKVKNQDIILHAFSTRVDTIYGVSYLAIGFDNEHLSFLVSKEQKEQVDLFVKEIESKTGFGMHDDYEKEGVFTGSYAINPINNEIVPIFVVNYVVKQFGTGVLFGVPAHDERDYHFALKYHLDIKKVIECDTLPYIADGKHINSPLINGLNIDDSKQKIINELTKNGTGKETTFYKLRDWIFSRQRYWGEPFPVLFDDENNIHIIDSLPVTLPYLQEYKPSGKMESPLANKPDWVNVTINKQHYRRETNTMPQWAGSSWYYLAYILKNDDGSYLDLSSKEGQDRLKRWLPVDLYIGGQEHAVLHLLYARFWHQFLYQIGLVPTKEPFYKVVNQGMILASNNEKMSKSKGNVINPDVIVESHGADTLRIYEMFMGPLSQSLPWSNQGLDGIRKWLDRVYRLYTNEVQFEIISDIENINQELTTAFHQFLKDFTIHIENMSFNLAVSSMMIFINAVYKIKQINYQMLDQFLICLSLYAPFLAEELHSINNKDLIINHPFPVYDENKLVKTALTIPVQINGKLKGSITVSVDDDDESIKQTALQLLVKKNDITSTDEPKKIIYIKHKIINFVF